jgi:hypothetical protein
MLKHRKGTRKSSRAGVFDTTRSAVRLTSVRRTLRAWGPVTNGITGATVAQSVGSDQLSTLVSDFGQYADLYQEYRVLGVKASVIPRYTSNIPLNVTLPPIQACCFTGISAVSAVTYSVAELADAQSFRFIPAGTAKVLTAVASSSENATSKLWFTTGGAVSPLATIGVVWSLVQGCPAAYNGVPIWDTLFEFDIEFRTAL